MGRLVSSGWIEPNGEHGREYLIDREAHTVTRLMPMAEHETRRERVWSFPNDEKTVAVYNRLVHSARERSHG